MNVLEQLKTSLADRYEIEREIGAGGMATVYLARDLRHDRPVAVKVLNPDLGAVLGVERFLAEIKVTANLQHPNLLPLFDSGEAGGLLFYVMPYVDGESLRAKLHREKQLPIDEAVRITTAIASALATAHEHGVIHRDLKPENILMQSGQPVIADFGIALAVSKAGGNRVTQTGISLGTPQYMSPEQATGDRVIDGRSDIYSLAAMAYEMLTGEAPHQGNTAQAIIARVLTERPRSIRLARESVPEHVAAAVEHDEKLAADRYSTAREFGEAIQGRGITTAHTSARAAQATPSPTWRARLRDPLTMGLGFVSLAAIASAVALAVRTPRPSDDLPPLQYVLWTADSLRPTTTPPWPAAISPDGGTIVYSVGAGARANSVLYFLRTDQLEPHLIPGSSGAGQPTFSPDGQWIFFETSGREMKVKLDGSAALTLAAGGAYNGADWTVKNEIILGATGRHGLSHLSSAGGDLIEFTHPDQSHGPRDHLWPVSTADGDVVVFIEWNGALSTAELAAANIASGEFKLLGLKAIRPLAVIDGALVFVRADGAVMAAPFDQGRLTAGRPIPVHDPVPIPPGNNGNSEVYVSRGGAMISSRGGTVSKMTWVDASGSQKVVRPEVRGYGSPAVSPDGKHVAVVVSDNQRSDVWLYEFASGTFSRLTSKESVSSFEWTADGKSIVFSATGEGGNESRNAAWIQAATGGSSPTEIVPFSELAPVMTRSRDGKWIVAQVLHNNAWDIIAVPVDSPGKRREFGETRNTQSAPAFSPDGHWLAMFSDESGRPEVYVSSFPDGAARVQLSVGDGGNPRWARDGQAVYYESGNNIVRVRLSLSPKLRVLSRDTALALKRDASLGSPLARGYDVTADGRFLTLMSGRDDYQLIIAPNWRLELRRRLAADGVRH